jgi:Flp pilus assembly protein TadG
MKRIAEKSIARHRGAVLVEMVIVTPVLLFIMMATAELTRAFIDHNTLTKAVRTGVRYVAANAFQGTTGVVWVSAALRAETQNLAPKRRILLCTEILPGRVRLCWLV